MLLPHLLQEWSVDSPQLSTRSAEIPELSEDYYYFSNATPLQGPFKDKAAPLRAVVSTVCALSMLGALLIIFSYLCIPTIRTKAREILVHLSVADFGVACANFIGITVNFDRFLRRNYSSTLHKHLLHLCTAQAFFAGFFTIASILWTLCLSVYIYFLVVHSHRQLHLKVIYFCYLFCWGVPLIVSLWLVFTDRLGYSPHGGSGWCSLIIDDNNKSEDIFITVFGNDLWIYLTFVLVTLLYLTTHCHIKWKIQGTQLTQCPSRSSVVHSADMKFLLIPLMFLLLRLGSIIIAIVFVYDKRVHVSDGVSIFLLYLAGIGDSGQGFVNAILFCMFTAKVREKLWAGVKKLYYSIACVRGYCSRRSYTSIINNF